VRPFRQIGILSDTALAMSAFCLLSLVFCTQATALEPGNVVKLASMQAPELHRRTYPRLLRFPKNISVGRLVIETGPGAAPTVVNQSAIGSVKVPADAAVRLELTETFFKDPTILKDLAPDSIDILIVRLSSMADAEEAICDNVLGHISHLTGLQAIYVDRSDVGDAGLSKLKAITNLRILEAGNSLVRGHALKDLSTLKELRTLRLCSTALDQDCLKYVSTFPKLEQLALTRTGLTSTGLKLIGNCLTLVDLDIGQNKQIADNDMQYVAALKKLTMVHLGNTSVTMAGLEKLKGLNLRRLFLPRSHYSAAEMAKVHKLFPLAKVELPKDNSVMPDSDEIKSILKPLSKDKGL
jgi:hypothetical protein